MLQDYKANGRDRRSRWARHYRYTATHDGCGLTVTKSPGSSRKFLPYMKMMSQRGLGTHEFENIRTRASRGYLQSLLAGLCDRGYTPRSSIRNQSATCQP